MVLNTRLPGGDMLNTPMPAGWNGASFGGAFATVIRRNAGVQLMCSHRCLTSATPFKADNALVA